MGNLSNSRHHYIVLDGLRGMAAICVMIFHRRGWFGGDSALGHAYLAVDFFFMLSAFVLTHAYAERLKDTRNFSAFVRDRIFRLHPMLVAGGLLAALVAFFQSRTGSDHFGNYAPATFISSMVPFPAFWTTSYVAFPWNVPVWSLFFELIASFIAGAFLINARRTPLLATATVSGLILAISSIEQNGFQVGYQRDPFLFWLGLPRVVFSFAVGVVVYRLHRQIDISAHRYGWLCAAILFATFAAMGHKAPGSSWYDLIVVFIIYPLLIFFAARADSVLPRFCVFLGAVSYPLYIVHEPILKIIGGGFNALGLSSAGQGEAPMLLEALMRLGLTVLVSFIILKVFDEPVRAYLKTRTKRRSASREEFHAR